MALALPVTVPERALLQEITFGIVLFTVIVQGSTAASVVRRAVGGCRLADRRRRRRSRDPSAPLLRRRPTGRRSRAGSPSPQTRQSSSTSSSRLTAVVTSAPTATAPWRSRRTAVASGSWPSASASAIARASSALPISHLGQVRQPREQQPGLGQGRRVRDPAGQGERERARQVGVGDRADVRPGGVHGAMDPQVGRRLQVGPIGVDRRTLRVGRHEEQVVRGELVLAQPGWRDKEAVADHGRTGCPRRRRSTRGHRAAARRPRSPRRRPRGAGRSSPPSSVIPARSTVGALTVRRGRRVSRGTL